MEQGIQELEMLVTTLEIILKVSLLQIGPFDYMRLRSVNLTM